MNWNKQAINLTSYWLDVFNVKSRQLKGKKEINWNKRRLILPRVDWNHSCWREYLENRENDIENKSAKFLQIRFCERYEREKIDKE